MKLKKSTKKFKVDQGRSGLPISQKKIVHDFDSDFRMGDFGHFSTLETFGGRCRPVLVRVREIGRGPEGRGRFREPAPKQGALQRGRAFFLSL